MSLVYNCFGTQCIIQPSLVLIAGLIGVSEVYSATILSDCPSFQAQNSIHCLIALHSPLFYRTKCCGIKLYIFYLTI